MKRAGWKPTKHSVLCEKHFQAQDYVTPPCKLEAFDIDEEMKKALTPSKKYLKADAVPPIFDFPPHLQSNVAARKPPAKRKLIPEKSGPVETEGNKGDDVSCPLNGEMHTLKS